MFKRHNMGLKELDETDRKILNFLKKRSWPATTEMVSKGAKINWNTAQTHLWKLRSERLVDGERVGRQNQWMLTRKRK